MAGYDVDRFLLEGKSSEEILRILSEEKDDYTPEAIEILEDILKKRGLNPDGPGRGPGMRGMDGDAHLGQAAGLLAITSPGDAVPVLNDLLNGVLSGTIDPQVAAVASNIVTVILHALEREFMTDSEPLAEGT